MTEEAFECFFNLGVNIMCEYQTFNFEKAIQKVKDQFQFDFVALALVQSAQFHFVLKWEYVLGNRSMRHKRIVLQKGKGIAGNVFKTGKPMFMANVEVELRREDLFNYPIIVAEGLTSFGATPLYRNGRVEAVLLAAFRNHRRMTPELFEKFQAAVAEVFGTYYNKEMVKEI